MDSTRIQDTGREVYPEPSAQNEELSSARLDYVVSLRESYDCSGTMRSLRKIFRSKQIKKGPLERMCGWLIATWKTRYCILRDQKFIYYYSKNTDTYEGVIDFNLLSCRLEVAKDKKSFRILVLKSDKAFLFRASDEKSLMEWIKVIQTEIASSKGYTTMLTRLALEPDYWRYFRINPKEIEDYGKILTTNR